MSQKAAKMCKSPKNHLLLAAPSPRADYEHLNTNCTIVGSNNLHLVKKPVEALPLPTTTTATLHLKSASPQLSMKPPTPQPTFPVMQIINPVMATRPIQQQPVTSIAGIPGTAGGMFKLKPPLNILPKPLTPSPTGHQPQHHHQQHQHHHQPGTKPAAGSPHIHVLPSSGHTPHATIMPQPLLLNQMPMLAAGPGMRFILQPQPAKTPQGLILQSGPGGQQLLQLQTPRSQPMVRVLTNGVGLPTATTFVTQMAPVTAAASIHPTTPSTPKKKAAAAAKKSVRAPPPKQKLDLANIMKLSGIGDEDDVMFEPEAVGEPEEKKLPPVQQPPPAVAPPIVQLLNQTFQTTATAPTAPTFSLAPNFAIGATSNGLMALQRPGGGFKLAVGDDGRLVLQHDPALNQDLQSQLLLQSIFGLNGSLIVQPASIDQQIHSQTVQTIQQQSVQTIQQQTVQSQTIQTVQHQIVQPQAALQSIQSQIQGQIQSLLAQQAAATPQITLQGLAIAQAQQHAQNVPKAASVTPSPAVVSNNHAVSAPSVGAAANHTGSSYFSTPTPSGQPVLKVQPFQKSIQPPVQTVHPLHHPPPAPPPPPPPSPAPTPPPINQHHHSGGIVGAGQAQPTSYVVNLTPDQLEQLKRNGQLTVNGQTIFMQRPANPGFANKIELNERKTVASTSPKIKPLKKAPPVNKISNVNTIVLNTPKTTATTIAPPVRNNLEKTINSVAGGGKPPIQPAAIVQPSKLKQAGIIAPRPSKVADVDRLLGQLMDEPKAKEAVTVSKVEALATTTCTSPPSTTTTATAATMQKVHTIQLTPAKQQHLKSIQLQIQTLSARMTPGSADAQHALKQLFHEQQKILASGKLLPPDKVYYHNNQLIVSNASIVKNEVLSPPLPGTAMVTSAAAAAPSVDATVTPPPMPQHKKAHLVEQQMQRDQSGAIKPDIHTPFRDKADACKRLVRYHCFDQPVLSEKDLGKADEIFELTARHFIGKFGRMVDKYRYLLHRESQRHVQTSELMMLDRMFLNEEQQSILKLRQEIDECNMEMQEVQMAPPMTSSATSTAPGGSDDYDEWACIQRELGCLPTDGDAGNAVRTAPSVGKRPNAAIGSSGSGSSEVKKLRMASNHHLHHHHHHHHHNHHAGGGGIQSAEATRFVLKSSSLTNVVNQPQMAQQQQQMAPAHAQNYASAYSACNMAAAASARSSSEENDSIDEQVQSAIDSILNLQQNNLDLDETMQSMLS